MFTDKELSEVIGSMRQVVGLRASGHWSFLPRMRRQVPELPRIHGGRLADYWRRHAIVGICELDRPGLVAAHDALIADCDGTTIDAVGFKTERDGLTVFQREVLISIDVNHLPLMDYLLAATFPTSGRIQLLPEDLWSLTTYCPIEPLQTSTDETLVKTETSSMLAASGLSIVYENCLRLNAPGTGTLHLVQHFVAQRVAPNSATALEAMAAQWADRFGGQADLRLGVAFTLMCNAT